jgi:hypothetical protein
MTGGDDGSEEGVDIDDLGLGGYGVAVEAGYLQEIFDR